MKIKDIKTKKAWTRILPADSHTRFVLSTDQMDYPEDTPVFRIMTQADFLREYYPSGHEINNPEVYPDIFREEVEDILDAEGNPTGNKRRTIYKECVPRYAFSFQQIISLKQCVHLCGNDIQFEMNTNSPTSAQQSDFSNLRFGWADKNMEVSFYEAVKSVKNTGDAALVGYLKDGVVGFKILSYLYGDILYPHTDPITGKMEYFARAYNDYDEDGKKVIEWVEVWDRVNLSRYKKDSESLATKIKDALNIEGYKMVYQKAHGFPFIPVAYKRDEDGPCWSPSQDSIDGYEMSFSQMAQNNQAYGLPILYFQGDGDTFDKTMDMNGSIKYLTMGKDDKASYLSVPNASESFIKQLNTLYKMIYEQSFTVIPPELKSGDLPMGALKILYSPAYEKAITDAAEYHSFLNDIIKIFLYGYGVENKKTIDYASIPLKCWIKPYVHLNDSSIITDLAQGVQNGFISVQTASEVATMYNSTGEFDRIMRERKQAQQDEIMKDVEIQRLKQPSNE